MKLRVLEKEQLEMVTDHRSEQSASDTNVSELMMA